MQHSQLIWFRSIDSSSYSWVPHLQIQPTAVDKNFRGKKKIQKVPKSKTWNYLNSIYLVSAMISKVVLVVKKLPANAGGIRDIGLIPGLGKSLGGGHGNPLQYSCLENPMDRGAWWAIVHGVRKSWRRLKQLGVLKHTEMITYTGDVYGRMCGSYYSILYKELGHPQIWVSTAILEPFTHGYRGTVVQINRIFLTYTILRKHFYLKNKQTTEKITFSDSQTWAWYNLPH